MRTIWKKSASFPSYNALDGDKKTDVLIIGGGLCGILCAYALKKRGVDHILIESDRIMHGVSFNTTAKITSQHGLIYHELIKRYGTEYARLYYRANEDALARYRDICKNIPCDFETKNAYVYSLNDKLIINDELEALAKINGEAKSVTGIPLPFEIAGAICASEQAQFDPVKFVSGILHGLNIYENTSALSWDGKRIVTNKGKITASKIIVATHFPFINKHGLYFLKMYQHRSYVLALKNAPNVDGMYVDESEYGMSFRNFKDMLLLGGGSHRTGKSGGNWDELSEFVRHHYPNSSIKYRFATQDCITPDSVPFIGNYSKTTPDMYVATGFNKWGMTSSMVAAELLADLVTDRNNPYSAVFSPSRSLPKFKLFINAGNAAIELITPTSPRCPHMGCALKWNFQEHSWDCPCHGSRFSEKGKKMDNPATGDLKIK